MQMCRITSIRMYITSAKGPSSPPFSPPPLPGDCGWWGRGTAEGLLGAQPWSMVSRGQLGAGFIAAATGHMQVRGGRGGGLDMRITEGRGIE